MPALDIRLNAIPVMRPRLPTLERLLPYLQQIDASGQYSNYGPLVRSLEGRLAGHFELPHGAVTTVANGTLGIALALMAQGAPRGTLCVLPAWTFVASAHAAVLAGLVPYFIDVEASNWLLDPDRLTHAVAAAPGPVGAVVPVLPFGRPIDVRAWERFHSHSGIPVVIDAAAGFDSLSPSTIPAVVSLHATKVVGAGEGGFVLSSDRALVGSVRARANFGFAGTREAQALAVNAKLSEYQAAVALAALDEWGAARTEWMATARLYRDALGDLTVQFQDGFGTDWISSTCVLSFPVTDVSDLESGLSEDGVDTRRWWGAGAHAHPATRNFPRPALPVTDALARSTLAVPFSRALDAGDIERVAAGVRKVQVG